MVAKRASGREFKSRRAHLFIMNILDIGAGMDATYGPVQDAKLRWLFRDTADRVRQVTGIDEFLVVDGADLRAPASFRDEGKRVELRGCTLDGVPSRKYNVITWLYPHPWEIIEPETGQEKQQDSPLDSIRKAIRDKLAPGGLLILETDMDDRKQPGVKKTQPADALALVLATLDTLLSRTSLKFHTNEPFRRLGIVYRKTAR